MSEAMMEGRFSAEIQEKSEQGEELKSERIVEALERLHEVVLRGPEVLVEPENEVQILADIVLVSEAALEQAVIEEVTTPKEKLVIAIDQKKREEEVARLTENFLEELQKARQDAEKWKAELRERRGEKSTQEPRKLIAKARVETKRLVSEEIQGAVNNLNQLREQDKLFKPEYVNETKDHLEIVLKAATKRSRCLRGGERNLTRLFQSINYGEVEEQVNEITSDENGFFQSLQNGIAEMRVKMNEAERQKNIKEKRWERKLAA